MIDALTVPTLDAVCVQRARTARRLDVLAAAQLARAIHCDRARYRGRRRAPGLVARLDAAAVAPAVGIAAMMFSASLVGVAVALVLR